MNNVKENVNEKTDTLKQSVRNTVHRLSNHVVDKVQNFINDDSDRSETRKGRRRRREEDAKEREERRREEEEEITRMKNEKNEKKKNKQVPSNVIEMVASIDDIQPGFVIRPLSYNNHK